MRLLKFDRKKAKINKGEIFCQEDKMKQDIQDILFITLGNQKWQGAAPSLINILIIRIGRSALLNLNWELIKMMKTNRILDPIAWARKYLIALSDSLIELEEKIKGINLKRFNSIIIHIKNQWEAEITDNEERIKVKVNIGEEHFNKGIKV